MLKEFEKRLISSVILIPIVIFFEKKLWPEFNEKDFEKIIKEYKSIKRNFGNI